MYTLETFVERYADVAMRDFGLTLSTMSAGADGGSSLVAESDSRIFGIGSINRYGDISIVQLSKGVREYDPRRILTYWFAQQVADSLFYSSAGTSVDSL